MSKTLAFAGLLDIGLLILGAPFSWAQPPVAPPEFEVASVKPMLPSPPYIPAAKSGGPGTTDPGQIIWSGANLKWLIETAYDVKPYQISGPAWLGSDRYMIVAKVPEGATKEQVNLMWQNLLKNRFGMVVHHESRVFQGEEMTLAKGASKLKETDLLDSAPRTDSTPQTMPGKDSKTGPNDDLHRFMPTPGWIVMDNNHVGPRRILARAQSLAQVASMLAQFADHPVIDKTGLTGKYDFTVEFDPNQPCVSCAVAIALEEELGLKVVKSTVRLDVIVVDHAEKVPTDN